MISRAHINNWTCTYACDWYRRASINPWSIFEDLSYDKQSGLYYDVIVDDKAISEFVTDVTQGELYLSTASAKTPFHCTMILRLADTDGGVGGEFANLSPNEKRERQDQMMVDNMGKLRSALLTLGDDVVKGLRSKLSSNFATIGTLMISFHTSEDVGDES
jgi:hypothetical protein